jgi:hypothetical protein
MYLFLGRDPPIPYHSKAALLGRQVLRMAKTAFESTVGLAAKDDVEMIWVRSTPLATSIILEWKVLTVSLSGLSPSW